MKYKLEDKVYIIVGSLIREAKICEALECHKYVDNKKKDYLVYRLYNGDPGYRECGAYYNKERCIYDSTDKWFREEDLFDSIDAVLAYLKENIEKLKE